MDLTAQNFAIYYQLTKKSDSLKLEDQKNQKYELDIYGQKSIFRKTTRKTSDSLISAGKLGFGYNIDPLFELYLTKNLKQNLFQKHFVMPLSRDKFLINIDDTLEWEILPETKVIENLNCQKAEVKYSGRKWTAWFTREIPVAEGPYYFHGLPGLILQIQDDTDDFIFAVIQIKKLSENTLYESKNGVEITWDQYQKQLQTFFKNPYSAVRVQGLKVYTDDTNGRYKEIDYRSRTKEMQKMLSENNNPIELDQKVDYK